MAYVRRKQAKGQTFYQLVESYRDGGKVRQRVIMHLGQYPTAEDAITGLRERAVRLRDAARQAREMASCRATERQYREDQEWLRAQYLRDLERFEQDAGERAQGAAGVFGWVGPERAQEARTRLEQIERDEYPGRWWERPRPEPPQGLEPWQMRIWNERHRSISERWRILDWSHARERDADEAERKAAQLEALTQRSD